MRLLHFADAHIDMANYGRHDPQTGLPLRVLDFLKSLDTIVDTAVAEKVDLVIFAGDAYKDRSPAPTFQREWGRRIMRLSQAQIPTLLLIGNHDLSPAAGRAHALQEFDTLQVPFVRVSSKPEFLRPDDLWGVPAQVLTLPWISRSGLLAATDASAADRAGINSEIEMRIGEIIEEWLAGADGGIPVVMAAHASVEGAKYGGERSVMLGADMVLPGALVRDPRLDYVAMGHIHKPQNLNENAHPPVVYPGSIERVDFGEVEDKKYFVVAEVARGTTQVEWRELKDVRPFVDRRVVLESADGVTQALKSALPAAKRLAGAIVRLVVEYPREWESLIDEPALRKLTEDTFEFHLIKRPLVEGRIRLPEDQTVSSLSPLDLLGQYWNAAHVDEDVEALQSLAGEIIRDDPGVPQA
jgi:exonuclease SbcD